MKVVINRCYGGYCLSQEAVDLYFKRTNRQYPEYLYSEISRDDPILVKIVEELGEKANGICAKLKIVDIPDDVEYVIEEYDGMEIIAEKHRTWC